MPTNAAMKKYLNNLVVVGVHDLRVYPSIFGSSSARSTTRARLFGTVRGTHIQIVHVGAAGRKTKGPRSKGRVQQ